MNLNTLRTATPVPTSVQPTLSNLPNTLPANHQPQPANTLDWCLRTFNRGPCPRAGRNDWLTALALFCNERGVPETKLLAWALSHPPLFDHGEKRIADTIKGNYQRNTAAHGSKAFVPSQIANELVTHGPERAPTTKWPAPVDLTPRLHPVPAFDETLFPPVLRPALWDLAYRLQCPPDWPAVAWIVMLGAVVGNRCGIHPKQLDTSWLEVPNFWGAIVAEPSKLKTPTLQAALKPLKEMDREAREEFQRAAHFHEVEAEVLKARKDALKKKLAKAASSGSESVIQKIKEELVDLEATAAPVARRYMVNDSTVEKLVEILSEKSPGLLVFRDELAGLLMSWEKQGRETDRQFYLEAWNGTSDFSSDRIGRGSHYVARCCISLLGGIQPDKLANYLRQTLHGENDGMIQRFSLLTWPDSLPFKYVDCVPDHVAQANAADLLRRLAELDPISAGAVVHGGDQIPAFHFNEPAQAVFIRWLEEWNNHLDTSDESPALVQHLAKYRKLYPALALLFHLLNVVSGNTPPGPVSQSAAELAKQWCTYFAAHARRLYGYGTNGGSTATLAEHLRAGHLQKDGASSAFSLRDVQRKGWHGLTDKSAIQNALDELMEANWIREMPPPPAAATGRPASPTYETNPAIFSSKQKKASDAKSPA